MTNSERAPAIELIEPSSAAGLTTEGKTSIAVTICTRDRPQRLQACIDSVMAMNVPSDVHPILIIIENDDLPKNQAQVLKLVSEKNRNWLIRYAHEPRLGIPIARNRALDLAIEINADWIAFIDDDEVVAPDWMQAMYEASRTYPADVYYGPVQYIYPPTTPAWVEQKELRQRPTGTRLSTAYTNNVMMKTSLARDDGLGVRFDESLRFSGGSDTDYYCRAADLGATICWTGEAIVKEPVTADRLTVMWQAKRAMRVAANASTLHKRRFGLWRALARYAPKCVVRIIGGTVAILAMMPLAVLGSSVGQRRVVQGLKDVYSGFGGLGAFMHFVPQPYLKIDGDPPLTTVEAATVQTRQTSTAEVAYPQAVVLERHLRRAAG